MISTSGTSLKNEFIGYPNNPKFIKRQVVTHIHCVNPNTELNSGAWGDIIVIIINFWKRISFSKQKKRYSMWYLSYYDANPFDAYYYKSINNEYMVYNNNKPRWRSIFRDHLLDLFLFKNALWNFN